MALMSSFAFGQTHLEFLEMSDNSYVEKSTYETPPIPIREINFIGDDNLTPEQNWKVYLAEGKDVLLEKSNAEIIYQGFVRKLSAEETIGFLDEEQAVQIKRSEAIQKTGIAWELILYGLYLVIIMSLFQRIVIKKTDVQVLALPLIWISVLTLLLGLVLALPSLLASGPAPALAPFLNSHSFWALILTSVLTLLLALALGSAPGSASGARKFFILTSGIFQALFSFCLFPDTEEIFSIWIVSVSFGLSTYYLWKRLEEKRIATQEIV